MTETPRSDRLHALAEAQRAFLDEAVRASGMTLTQIARAGQINPSTLTRFRNDKTHGGTLSYPTIATVSEVSGVPAPQEILGGNVGATPRRAFREAEAVPYDAGTGDVLARAVAALVGNHAHLVAWELRSRALEYENYQLGDVLIVDLNGEPKSGDIVCAQLYDWTNPAATQTVFRLYEAPFLIGAGPVDTARKPRAVDGENVIIKGVVGAMLRPLCISPHANDLHSTPLRTVPEQAMFTLPTKPIRLPEIPAETVVWVLIALAAFFFSAFIITCIDRWYERRILRAEGLGRDLLLPSRKWGR